MVDAGSSLAQTDPHQQLLRDSRKWVATNDDGTAAAVSYALATFRALSGHLETSEGQTVLTNGVNVGGRPEHRLRLVAASLVRNEGYPVGQGSAFRSSIAPCSISVSALQRRPE